MCKPSCCPGDNGSGLGMAIAVIVGLAVISAVARPVIHAAEELLQIAVITLTVLAGVAILTTVTVLVIRFRRSRRTTVHPLTRTDVRQVAGPQAQGLHAQLVKPGTWSHRDPRFIYRAFELTQPSSGCADCDSKIAEWFYYADDLAPDARNHPVKARRWL